MARCTPIPMEEWRQAPKVSLRSAASDSAMINPRRACARVTVVVVCVCLSVYPSVPALAASASGKQRYSRVMCGVSKKPSVEKLWREKIQYANELELTVSRFCAVSGPTKHSSYVKGNWWVE